MGGLLSVAAQNVHLEFTPASGVHVNAVHTGFKTTDGSDRRKKIDLGDVLAEEEKDVLFDLSLPPADAQTETEVQIGTLSMSYLDVQGGRLRTMQVTCTVRRASELPQQQEADETIALHKARIETAAGLGDAQAAAEAGRYAEARSRLQQAWDRVQAVAGGESSLKTQLGNDLLEAMEDVRDRDRFHGGGRGKVAARGKAHRDQRSACLSGSDDEEEEEEEEEAEAGNGAKGGQGCKRGQRGKHSYANACQKRKRMEAKACVLEGGGQGSKEGAREGGQPTITSSSNRGRGGSGRGHRDGGRGRG
jgi:hypothetical protein